MHIIKDDILAMLGSYMKIAQGTGLGGIDIRVNDHVDTQATYYNLRDAKVIVFDTDQALALLPAIDGFEDQLDFRLPFPEVMFQFTKPIPETDLLQQEREHDDSIQAIIVSQNIDPDPGLIVNNASVWFGSSAINRVQWNNAPVSDLRIAPTVLEQPDQTGTAYLADNPVDRDVQIANKYVIRLLVCAMVAYINCDNVELSRVETSAKVNAKRIRKGKKELKPYYTVRVSKRHTEAGDGAGAGKGRSVSFRFDVRGHFRNYKSGKVIWVNSHQRGLKHERYIPKAYRVD